MIFVELCPGVGKFCLFAALSFGICAGLEICGISNVIFADLDPNPVGTHS